MNTHTGGQYTYPTVGGVIPTNLNAYQRQQQQPVQPQRTATQQQQYAQQTQQQYAQQQYIQQQRTTTANTQQQQTTSSNRVATANKVQPVGQYASSSLSTLSSAISAEKKSKKRKAKDNAKVLDSVVPLFNNATNSKSKCNEEEGIDDNEEEQTETASERKVKQLRKQLDAVKKDNQSLMERRNNVMKNMIKCHEIYETGLDGIARMNDLRYVPDNVLPDELPDTVPQPTKS